jgi:hypothetical protein
MGGQVAFLHAQKRGQSPRYQLARSWTKLGRGWISLETGVKASMLDPEQYLNERVKQYQSWYDRKAVIAKSRFLLMRGSSVVGGALVPVLANMNIGASIAGYPVMTLLVTAISLMVVVFVSLESVLHYREQWKNYRSTEQRIGHEVFRYQTKVAPYVTLDEEAAFKLFVERVEDAIAAENAATLNVMTLASEAAESRAQIKADGNVG